MDRPLEDPEPIPAFYEGFAPPAPPAPPLAGAARRDVVVIGGGFTGISTALHLALAGVAVTVLEAREIGRGASSRNFGQVVPYFKHSESHVLAHFGAGPDERLIEGASHGPDLVFGLIERFGIDCSARRSGLIFAAHTPAGQAALERRATFWQHRGADVTMQDRAATEALIGSRLYDACLLDRRGGSLNPLAYLRGLAAAAQAAGAVIHADSPVLELARDGAAWRARTAGGSVTAESAVIATNAYTEGLWPGLRQTIVPLRGHQMVSRPLGANRRRGILPGGQALTDTRRLFSGVRLHDDGSLQASADGPVFAGGGFAFAAKLDRRLAALYPDLGPLEWQHRWSGWVAMSYDHYPHLHELAPGLWAGLGYSGRGIALATMMGREIAGRIAGQIDGKPAGGAEPILPVTPLRPRWTTRFAKPLVSGLLAWQRLRDALDERRYRRPAAAR